MFPIYGDAHSNGCLIVLEYRHGTGWFPNYRSSSANEKSNVKEGRKNFSYFTCSDFQVFPTGVIYYGDSEIASYSNDLPAASVVIRNGPVVVLGTVREEEGEMA